MSDSWEKTPNVESVNQWNRSGSRIELPEIQEELNKTVSSAPNPKKAPLNYIDNMEEWEKSQKKYWREVHEKQKELESILQASEDKQTELDLFRDERTKLGVELQKIEWSLLYKLSDKIDFFNDIANGIKEWAEQQLKKLRITMKWEENGGKQVVKLISDRELSQEEQDMVYEQFVAQMAEQWRDMSNVNVEFECDNGEQADEPENLGDVEDAESVWWDGFDEEQWDWDILDEDNNLENPEWHEDQESDFESYEEEETGEEPNLLQLYLQLTEGETKDYFLSFLNDEQKKNLWKLEWELKDQITKYKEIQRQIYSVSNKIKQLVKEMASIDDDWIECEESIRDLSEKMEKTNQSYFLNSHKSTKKVSIDDFVATPAVKKQINHILNLYKKWLSVPKTILLYWWHNLWKTYAANVLSSELWLDMYHIKSYDIFNSEYPDPAEMLKAIFSFIVRKNEPCIIFLDEMEKFSGGSEWSTYQKVLENTLRHHISKIKESNRDIIIIWAVSSWWKLDPSLLKQDVFQKQIPFEKYWDDECKELLQQIMQKKWLKFDKDVKLSDIISKLSSSEEERNPEYIKCLIDTAEDYHLLNSDDPEFDTTISASDINEAIKLMKDRNHSSAEHMWY